MGYVWPEPNSSAAGSHMMSLLTTFMQQGWQVTFASPAQRGEHKSDLSTLGITEQQVALNCSSFDRFINELSPDVVVFDRFMLEEQFGWRVAKHCPSALRLLDTEDLHFLRNARHQAIKRGGDLYGCQLKTEMAKREVAAIFRCDMALIISDYEYQLLQNEFQVPKSLLYHLPFMLDLSGLDSAVAPFEQRRHFISIGNFRHAPNWDAVLQLRQHIWPAIRQQLPDAELHIFGAYPPPKATQLHDRKNGFLVKGWAEDARAVMSDSRICLAPLRFGAGIKGKLTEAMLCGTPSITTPVGAEGMAAALPWPGAICHDDGEFVRQAVACYQDKERWQHSQQQGYALLRARYDKNKLAPGLIARINQLHDNLESHREGNFIGGMLQHHLMKSTQYMAQWIEAKNRPPESKDPL